MSNGVMANDIYLSLVNIHGTIMVFFVLTAYGTFSNLLIPLQIGARYGFRFYEYDFLLVLFIKCNHDFFFIC
jgi:heme/copper-type cytochrome/quinol oxidase subunit 1